VQTRGAPDLPYYNGQPAPRTAYASEKLPSLPYQQVAQAYSSANVSPRVSSISSSVSSNTGSQSSFTTAPSSSGPKTPGTLSPPPPTSVLASGTPPNHAVAGYDSYPAMNSGGAEMYYQPHMSAGQAQPPQTVTSSGMPHYGHQQPPLLQPGPAQYSTPAAYPQYGYANGLTSPPTGPPAVSNSMGGQNVLPLPGVAAPQSGMPNQYQGFDTTGQIAPPGMKPRVTATLWEDEGSLCFQVEARGICVARREGTLSRDITVKCPTSLMVSY
jgi:enhanced filamentous growth protein 1